MLTKLWGCRLDSKLNEFNRHSNYLVGAGMISCEDDDCAESAICRANRYYESAILHYLLVVDITMKNGSTVVTATVELFKQKLKNYIISFVILTERHTNSLVFIMCYRPAAPSLIT